MTTLAEERVVAVVEADDMDDETFIKHMNARHAPLVCQRGANMARWLLGSDVGAVRVFHKRLHDIGVPNNEVTGHYHH